jgi:dienelactone hydrolase
MIARAIAVLLLVAALPAGLAHADGPRDNIADNVRPIPPLPTKELSPEDRAELGEGVAKLAARIESLRSTLTGKPHLLARLADVQIFYNAVRYPLTYHEQIDPKAARKALEDGMTRARQLAAGEAPWLAADGPRGYVSRIDGSVQPYLLFLPPSYNPDADRGHKYRLDLVSHGRNENLTELVFINGKKDHAVGGDPEKFVCQLYGRYCNANKFAGEIDLLEALDAIKSQYPIDENRLLNIGFSMGGAACWQFAVHYTDLFAANSPGAGFAETREFLHDFQNEAVKPTWYERKLWHLYDCTDYVANLANGPTIAYAGELDSQKQASDIMLRYAAEDNVKIDRILGPNTKHAYEKGAKAELDKRLDALLAKGRDPMPRKLRFTTWTLRYNRMFWLTVDGMGREWERARVEAEVADSGAIDVKTQNVTALTLDFEPDHWPPGRPSVTIDGTRFDQLPAATKRGALVYHFAKTDQGWQQSSADDGSLKKRHGLQGPIDDAFMDSFIIVEPTGTPLNDKVGAWAASECRHAIDHWRKQFRGEARVKTAEQITDADIQGANLILFGDPSSNPLIGRIADKLPLKWSAAGIAAPNTTFQSDHALVLVYSNPLNPKRYVVLNSGFTFREYDYLNNARQVPRLPDYAVIDVSVPVTSRAPGGVVDAGFFGERWELLPDGGRGDVK